MHMENSLLDNISFVGHLYYYFDGWRNGKTGAISNVAGDFIYRFVEAKRNEKGNLVDVYEHKKDNPIVAVGIVAYWLSFRRNSNPFIHSLGGGAKRETKFFDEIFESYTKERYKQFKERYKDSPDSWKWNWDYEFYGKMIIPNEIMLNKQTEALFEYITDKDIKLVHSVMDNYIEYLKKCRTDRNIHVSAELKVLRSINLMDESMLEDLEDFEVNTILDKLESNGYVKVAWVEGHAPEAVKLLDAGRMRLKELEMKTQNEESELERLRRENETLRRHGRQMHPAARARLEFWANWPEEQARRKREEEQEQARREWEKQEGNRRVQQFAELLSEKQVVASTNIKGSKEGGKKLGAKTTYFKDYIINNEEADKVIEIIKKNINKDVPQLAALLIVGAIEANKVSIKVTAPSIEREFGVKGSSIKPHLTKYRRDKDNSTPYFSVAEISPYKKLFSD